MHGHASTVERNNWFKGIEANKNGNFASQSRTAETSSAIARRFEIGG